MAEKNINAARLSVLSGIGKPTIHNWIYSKYEPNNNNKAKLADALGLPVDVFGEEPESINLIAKPIYNYLLSVKEAAEIMGVSQQMLRNGILQDQWNPSIGSAIKGSGKKYRFHIPAKRVQIYMAVESKSSETSKALGG